MHMQRLPTPAPPPLQHYPLPHGSSHSCSSLSGSSAVNSVDLSLPHVADVIAARNKSAHSSGSLPNDHLSNGHLEFEVLPEERQDESLIRRSTRIKREPMDLCSVSTKPSHKKSRRTPAPSPVPVARAKSSLAPDAAASHSPRSSLVTQGTQTDLTIFHMAFMRLEPETRSKSTGSKQAGKSSSKHLS